MKFHNLLIYRLVSHFLLRLSIVLSTAVMIVVLGCSVPPEPAASDSRERSGEPAKDHDISEAEVKLSRVEPQTVLGDDLSLKSAAPASAADAAVAEVRDAVAVVVQGVVTACADVAAIRNAIAVAVGPVVRPRADVAAIRNAVPVSVGAVG